MKTLFTFVMAWAVVLVVIVGISRIGVNAQITGNPCQCNDVDDLIRLLGRYNAVIDKLEQLEKTVSPEAVFDDIQPDPNPRRVTKGESLLETLNQTMNFADPDHTSDKVGACTKSIWEMKESFRSAYKDYYKPAPKLSLYFYMRRETDIYVRTVDEIVKRINSMEKCGLDDWFGTITVKETKEQLSEERQPATDRFNLGGLTTQTDTYTRTGAIHIGRPDLVSYFQVVGKLTRTESHNSMHDCDSRIGAQFVELKPFRTERSEVITKTGSEPFQMYVVPDVDWGRFQIHFQIPAIPILSDVSVSDIGRGGCPGEEYNRPESARGLPSTIGPQDAPLEGQVLQGGPREPQRINGSKTIDHSNPNVKLTHTIRVTYNLYKLKPSPGKTP